MIAGILTTIYFFLPAGVANMAPVLVKKLNLFNYPIDCNAKLNNKPILGKNKTFRGLIFGTIFSIITIYLQFIISLTYPNLSIINYSNYNLIWLGFLLGFGALFGDICKSFFKRLNNIESGKSWTPFDQIDWVVGGIVFTMFLINYSTSQILTLLIFFGSIHPIVNIIGWKLEIKKNKF